MSFFDLAIVGAGPTGVSLANLVAARGHRVLIIERDVDIYPLPRAIHFDGEVMRIFHDMGLASDVQAVSRPGLQGMHFLNAAQETLMIRGGTAAVGMHGCANNHYFHQPQLEAVLRAGLRRFPETTLLTGHEVTDIQPMASPSHGAILKVHRLSDGGTLSYQARYVVGCDGARSMVRRLIGSERVDLGLHQPWLVFDVLLNDDAPVLPAYTIQHCEPQRPMTSCNVIGRRRRWEIMLMPGDDPQELVKPATIWALIDRWLKPDQAQIERSALYTFHSVIARGWRRGPLLIAGDSAHQTPPFLGQGMCAGIRDAANLAWKLDAVLRGKAADSLLDTYESERAPHVQAFIELAVRLGNIIQTTDPDEARERDQRFRAGGTEVFNFPAPGLGPGLHLNGQGQVFGQPVLENGQPLDPHAAGRFVQFQSHADAPPLPGEALTWMNGFGCVTLDAGTARLPDGQSVAQWMQERRYQRLLLRPDHYVAAAS